ncbi:glycosyltransferase [Lacihabitans sp. LS3-19]|uniref:glycosyltransferase n=1 Tax=Lacihabitans sp. LS3-19 TaxID=2487335 RepID=UPI0020CE9DC3|nr:glycosyltransferase [Lacihabitans sp. LS3-19]MCP9766966.1 glycosyltransferase [Lacihabitans sp. LS3-19]
MRKYSVIIPIYNRPDELDELLESLKLQTFKNFEIIVIEDGSVNKCEHIVVKHRDFLDIKYFYKTNGGQGFARNFGFEKACGDYFVQFDSDAIIPENYFELVEIHLQSNYIDAYGGPDAAHSSFTDTQKAINFAMTSVLTTGGTRGKKKNLGGKFHPRSFNFGISRKVYETVGGYKITRMGEDIEYSIRIIEAGFNVGLIPEAFIYHKRRTSLSQFYKQLFFFGRARINIGRFFPKELKLVHFFPVAFTLFVLSIPFQFLIFKTLGLASLVILIFFLLLIFMSSTLENKSISVGLKSIPAAFIQLFAYGMGFLKEAFFGKSMIK